MKLTRRGLFAALAGSAVCAVGKPEIKTLDTAQSPLLTILEGLPRPTAQPIGWYEYDYLSRWEAIRFPISEGDELIYPCEACLSPINRTSLAVGDLICFPQSVSSETIPEICRVEEVVTLRIGPMVRLRRGWNDVRYTYAACQHYCCLGQFHPRVVSMTKIWRTNETD